MATSEAHVRSLALSRAVNQVAEAILRSDHASSLLQSVVNITGPALGVDRALIYDVRLEAGVAVGLCEWLRPGLDITPTRAEYPLRIIPSAAQEMARTGAPLESSRDAIHPLLARDGADEILHGQMSIRRLLWFPFQRRPDGYYVLVVNQITEERSWSADELKFVEAVAGQVSLAIMKLDLLRERDQAMAELSRSETRFRLLYDQTPSMFFTVDRDHVIRSVNRFAIEHLGYSSTELVGQSVMHIVHAQDVEKVARHLGACFAGSGSLRTESFRKVRRDGSVIWVKETARVVEGPDGANIFIVCDDVTESRVLEEAARRAESRSHDRDEFMAMLGHELRNPLAPIVTALDVLRQRGHEDRELEVIQRQVMHLRRLVDDLLDVSRITRGRVELHMERVDLATVATQAVEIARPLLERKRQRLTMAIDPPRLTLDADPSRLVQVFGNLLTNAAKFSAEGKEVTFTAERRGDRIVVRVHDEGEGIEPEMLERVFELFVQRSQPVDRAQSGLGLGLTIARNLIGLHGGTVRALSDGRGRGTTLEVELPAATSEPTTGIAAAAPASSASPSIGTPAASILVVDDNKDARELLCEGLMLMGYRVEAAGDGPSALSAAERFAPNVALVDIGLPGMDGYELAHRLRSAYDGLRLVALTGYGQESDRIRTREAGFDAHLVKPIELDELQRLLEGTAPRALR